MLHVLIGGEQTYHWFFCLCVVMANSIYLPKVEQTIQNLSRALFKLRIVWQIKEISIFIHSVYFKGREKHFCIDVLQAHIQGEQKGLADPHMN